MGPQPAAVRQHKAWRVHPTQLGANSRWRAASREGRVREWFQLVVDQDSRSPAPRVFTRHVGGNQPSRILALQMGRSWLAIASQLDCLRVWRPERKKNVALPSGSAGGHRENRAPHSGAPRLGLLRQAAFRLLGQRALCRWDRAPPVGFGRSAAIARRRA